MGYSSEAGWTVISRMPLMTSNGVKKTSLSRYSLNFFLMMNLTSCFSLLWAALMSSY